MGWYSTTTISEVFMKRFFHQIGVTGFAVLAVVVAMATTTTVAAKTFVEGIAIDNGSIYAAPVDTGANKSPALDMINKDFYVKDGDGTLFLRVAADLVQRAADLELGAIEMTDADCMHEKDVVATVDSSPETLKNSTEGITKVEDTSLAATAHYFARTAAKAEVIGGGSVD